MKYFFDTEFLEGKQDKRILGIKIGETKPTIDLISIGIVGEDGREYYAVSKDFNLHEAWNRFDLKEQTPFEKSNGFSGRKVYWIRENVLKPIFREWLYEGHIKAGLSLPKLDENQFTYKKFKKFLNHFGKSNHQIAEEIYDFCITYDTKKTVEQNNPEFYAYFADYDWVAFCWIFGKMMDLPKGFPMYCNDLKQILDEKVKSFCWKEIKDSSFDFALKRLKTLHPDYPQQENEHNALSDARWNLALHKFINSL